MLIDFDHAICEDDKDAIRHFERTGTLPFMSINNLEGGKLEHSLLDDWESLIYILCWVGTYDWKKKDESGERPSFIEHTTASLHQYVLDVATPRNENAGLRANEISGTHTMYPWVKALFIFIADAIDKEDHNSSNSSNSSTAAHPLLRKIVSFKNTDRTPEGADDQDRIDIGLTVKDDIAPDSPYRESTMPSYSKMLALIEAKRSSNNQSQQDAYAQLFKYSRHIYVNQHDRRFVWGLTVCDSSFRICLLGYKRMLSSAPIDVATPDGRETLVKWLANMSLYERDRLGYDPTLYFNSEKRRWEIKAYDDSTDAHKTFEIVSCMRISDHIEASGMLTRIGDADEHDKRAEVREVLVKRAWAIASQKSDDKSRDEVSMLREINNALKGNKDLEGKYPTLLAGGVVKITDENGE
ncbi:hypothetical protein IW138_006561, partial [Coemansia sp. RSA 986]